MPLDLTLFNIIIKKIDEWFTAKQRIKKFIKSYSQKAKKYAIKGFQCISFKNIRYYRSRTYSFTSDT